MTILFSVATAGVAAAICAGLILVIRPWLQRYALARPNARSSHTVPTPQGGGIAVVAAMIVGTGGALLALPAGAASPLALAPLGLAAVVISGVGAIDDIHPIGVIPRLALQTLAVATVIYTLPADLRTLPALPWTTERLVLVVGGVWFVNLVNFMDGLDWMTVVEVVPITATLAAIGLLGLLPAPAVVVGLVLCGAMIGFAIFNRPVAKLFLGDVGSLPIGLVLGWLLVLLAGNGGRAAALMLPLYYLADSTITLLRRLLNAERVWQAHRTHFYQRATDRGFSVMEVVTRVFTVNVALCGLAATTVIVPGRSIVIAALFCGAALVAWLLAAFARGRKAQ